MCFVFFFSFRHFHVRLFLFCTFLCVSVFGPKGGGAQNFLIFAPWILNLSREIQTAKTQMSRFFGLPCLVKYSNLTK